MMTSPHARRLAGVRLVAAAALITATLGCKSRLTVTLCSTASQPTDFAVQFTRGQPAHASGTLPPHGRVTVETRPEADGDYTLELRRSDRVTRHPGRYYTSDGGSDTFTIDDNLDVSDGCRVESGSAAAPR